MNNFNGPRETILSRLRNHCHIQGKANLLHPHERLGENKLSLIHPQEGQKQMNGKTQHKSSLKMRLLCVASPRKKVSLNSDFITFRESLVVPCTYTRLNHLLGLTQLMSSFPLFVVDPF